jgi:hypothetical protein
LTYPNKKFIIKRQYNRNGSQNTCWLRRENIKEAMSEETYKINN